MPFSRFLIALIVSCMVALASAHAFTPTEDGLYAVFDTTEGEFTAKLHYDKVPMTVANFVGLAENSVTHYDDQTGEVRDENFYDGIIFHRVSANFVIQAGSPLGNGTDGPGYSIPDEISPDLSHNKKGVLSMANSGSNSGGSQFFVTLNATNASHLNGIHSVFGEVVDGIEVVDTIGFSFVDSNERPLFDVTINTVTIVREGEEAAAFNPADYLNRYESTEPGVTVSYDDSGTPTAVLEIEEGQDFFVLESSDMETWSNPRRLALDTDLSEGVKHSFDWPASGGKFYQYTELAFPWVEERVGATFTFSVPGVLGEHVVTFGEDFQGTFTSGYSDGNCGYAWFDMGKVIQVYLNLVWTDEGIQGGYQAQVYFLKDDLNAGECIVIARSDTNSINSFNIDSDFEYVP